MPSVNPPSDWNSQLQQYLDAMNAKGYTELAIQFQAFATQFHAQHPDLSVKQALQAFLATELGKGLAAGLGGTTTLLTQIPQAAATGAEKAVHKLTSNPLSTLFSLTGGPFSQNFWIRAAEVVLGLGLIIVGLAHMAPGGAIASIARKARLL